VPFPTAREAEIAYNTLTVDEEPKRSTVLRKISLTGNALQINFSAKEARQLRVSCNSFLDHLILVTKTMEEFGPPK